MPIFVGYLNQQPVKLWSKIIKDSSEIETKEIKTLKSLSFQKLFDCHKKMHFSTAGQTRDEHIAGASEEVDWFKVMHKQKVNRINF